MKETLASSPKFRKWKDNLKKNGLQISGIKEVYTKHRYNGEVLFSLVLLDARTPEDHNIPPVCFLKGASVSILIVLVDRKSREKSLLLVKQRRVCSGDFIYEHVAGMVDGEDDPLAVAVREASEEADIQLSPSMVIPLNQEPYYPSSGTSDESIYFFYTEIEMSEIEIASYHKRNTGAVNENEQITTHIATIPEALTLIKNTNGLLNIYLYLDALSRS